METDAVAIKAIDPSTIHQIQSGQVIVDLCSVAKELVENSLDAGATIIDVRFKNQGLDTIEVQDNGAGISPQNHESIALKHYTSKLSTYADLTTLHTFGFRGEALSSLCALSRFSIVTCLQSEAPKAKRLEFETSGKLKSATIVAGQKGTTATVEDLFYNLPVRRREQERSIKREWGKVLGLLNQYACVQTGVKLSVWQQPNKGKRMLLFSTKGNKTTRDNIINVFGAKTMNALITLDVSLQLESTHALGLRRDDQKTKVHEVRVVGHVSRPVHGGGRQTPDRQMFYVNGRPCGLPQFAKVFNEVYRSYNSSQSPFIFADIQLDTCLYDVNVSPDKRTILLHDQGKMLEHLRDRLVELFETQDYTVPRAELSMHRQTPLRAVTNLTSDSPVPLRTLGSRASESETSAVLGAGALPLESPEPQSDHKEQSENPSHVSPNSSRSPSSLRAEDAAAPRDIGFTIKGKQWEQSTADPEDVPETTTLDEAEAPLHGDKDAGRDSVESPARSPETSQPRSSTLSQWLSGHERHGLPHPGINQSGPTVAKVSLGKQTSTTDLGPALKRQRLDAVISKGNHPRRSKLGKRPRAVPTFGGRLSQMFAATAERASNTNDAGAAPVRQGLESVGSSDVESDEDEESGANSPASSAGSDNRDDEHEAEDEDGENSQAESESVGAPSASIQGRKPANNDESDGKDDGSEFGETDGERGQEEEGLAAQDMIGMAENQRKDSSEQGEKRAQLLVKGSRRKDATHQLLQRWKTDEDLVIDQFEAWQAAVHTSDPRGGVSPESALRRDSDDPEATLSLKISKSDFGKMRIIGQFNMGFILAVRPPSGAAASNSAEQTGPRDEDDLFIIDQHASDEKYNFERLQASTVMQSQRLVQPKTLELTAVEEEIVKENVSALEANGFVVRVDDSGAAPVGSRVQLLTLPLSRETTFSLADLEELIFLLGDSPASGSGSGTAVLLPRPSRTRKMFAMRACRSSIMIGRALSAAQMERVVKHMGEMEKPWNCPHGRPTMRHLCGLGAWDEKSWRETEQDDEDGGVDWAEYVSKGQ